MSHFFPGWPLRRRVAASTQLAVVTTFAIAWVLGSLLASGASPQVAAQVPVPAQDVFAAVEAGDLEVSVVPQNERRVTIQLKNKTERPLTIQLPPALAAAPILAQQPGLFNAFPNPGGNRNQQQQAPQQLGLGMNGGNQQQGGNNLFPGGMFNIPAGRAIKIKAEAVCLEFGKPNPDVRMKYELKPLASICDKPELAAVLTSLGQEQIDQRTAQAAAWHVTDDLSFEKLVGLLRRDVGATKEFQFTRDQVAAARGFLKKAAEADKAPRSSRETASTEVRGFAQ